MLIVVLLLLTLISSVIAIGNVAGVVMAMVRMIVAITVIDVLDLGPGPEHHIPDCHENGRVQGHVVHHQRRHDHHLEVGQNDRRESQCDQLWYHHVRVHRHLIEVPAAFSNIGGGRSR